MQQTFTSTHKNDEHGRPAGGHSKALGIEINWQDGPLRLPNRQGNPMEPNGAFVETVIAIAADRIRYYNDNGFSCRENSLAITKLEEALHWLNARTQRRTQQGVEGTHEGS